MQSQPFSTPNFHRRKISHALSKLSLNKMKAFVSPSTAHSHHHSQQSPDTDHSSELESDSSLSSVSPPPCTSLLPDSQTMKNYANQRSDKIPLRVPALFPASINFSQQTIYLFDSNDDEDSDNNMSCYLNDLLREPVTETDKHLARKGHQKQASKASGTSVGNNKQRTSYLPGKSTSEMTQNKKMTRDALPSSQSLTFHTPAKSPIKRPDSSFFHRAVKTSLSSSTPTPKLSKLRPDPQFARRETDYAIEITSPVPEFSHFSERNRLLSLPTRLECTQAKPMVPVSKPLQVIPEQSMVSSPTLSFDSRTALLHADPIQREDSEEPICPRIDMVLTTSPFFNKNHSTLFPMTGQEPGTPMAASSRGPMSRPFPTLTPYTVTGPETPSTCVNSCSAQDDSHLTPHGKFAMATGSPGIFNLPVPASSQQQQQQQQQPSTTPIRRQYSLLSPHPLPSPLPPRDPSLHASSRGPGADMLATLEFLSDLCHKSPESLEEEHDSLLERASLAESAPDVSPSSLPPQA